MLPQGLLKIVVYQVHYSTERKEMENERATNDSRDILGNLFMAADLVKVIHYLTQGPQDTRVYIQTLTYALRDYIEKAIVPLDVLNPTSEKEVQ